MLTYLQAKNESFFWLNDVLIFVIQSLIFILSDCFKKMNKSKHIFKTNKIIAFLLRLFFFVFIFLCHYITTRCISNKEKTCYLCHFICVSFLSAFKPDALPKKKMKIEIKKKFSPFEYFSFIELNWFV